MSAPWRFAATLSFPSEQQARRFERYLKGGSDAQHFFGGCLTSLQFIFGYDCSDDKVFAGR